MKINTKNCYISLIGLVLFSACSITSRKYMPGYSINFNIHNFKNKENQTWVIKNKQRLDNVFVPEKFSNWNNKEFGIGSRSTNDSSTNILLDEDVHKRNILKGPFKKGSLYYSIPTHNRKELKELTNNSPSLKIDDIDSTKQNSTATEKHINSGLVPIFGILSIVSSFISTLFTNNFLIHGQALSNLSIGEILGGLLFVILGIAMAFITFRKAKKIKHAEHVQAKHKTLATIGIIFGALGLFIGSILFLIYLFFGNA